MAQDQGTQGHARTGGGLIELPDAQKALRAFSAAITNYNIYPSDHVLVTTSRSALWEAIAAILAKRDETSIERIEDEFSFEGLPILGVRDQAKPLSERFEKLGVEIVKFSRGLDERELAVFIQILGDAIRNPQETHDIAAELQSRNVTHVRLGRLAAMGPSRRQRDRMRGLEEVYSAAVGVVRDLMGDARRGKTLDIKLTQNTVVHLVERMLRQKDSTLALAMMKTYDEYLFVHSVNVTILTLGIAETFSSDEELLIALGKAAMLHDIGKTAVPSEILNKPSPLDDKEWEIMRSHPEIGMRMIEKSYNKFNMVSMIAFEHHLHFDGGGYPSQRFRHEWTPYSMMVSIADCYDALTTDRPYRGVMTPEAALNLMAENSGAHFEPRLLRSFLLTMGIYPVGSLVKLSTGEVCVIKGRNPTDATRPGVVVILDPAGKQVDDINPLDLAERSPFTGEHLRSIKEAVPYTKLPGVDLSRYLAG